MIPRAMSMICIRVFYSFGFVPNFAAGKTECVVTLAGSGAAAVAESLFVGLGSCVSFSSLPMVS
eukprot:714468-Karenia_brevis.AAC.1